MINTNYPNKSFQQGILTVKLTVEDTEQNLILISQMTAFLQTLFSPKSFSSIFHGTGHVYYCYVNIPTDTLAEKLEEIRAKEGFIFG